MDLDAIFGTTSPLIGMVHVPALPGAPEFGGSRRAVRSRALGDAHTLLDAGMDGLLVENFGDVPYHPADVPKHTVAELTATARDLRSEVDYPVGVNVLRNDAGAALAVTAAAGGDFVRINVHTGTRATDQGLLDGRAHETLRLRREIDAEDVSILADVAVKHSDPLVRREITGVVAETIERGLADGLVVSGRATGEAADVDLLAAVLDARDDVSREIPVFVGSGVTPENVADLLDRADGAIVGTSLQEAGVTGNEVDAERVTALVEAATISR